MIYLYNTESDTYRDLYRTPYDNLQDYLSDYQEGTDVYKVVYLVSVLDVFEKARQKSAIRGRFAKNENGERLIDVFALTNDEFSFVESILPSCAAKVFQKLSAWCKDNLNAFQQNISFGNRIAIGVISSAVGTTINDSSANYTINSLKGYRIIILDANSDINEEEREIISNSATSIVIEREFSGDPTGLAYGIYNPSDKYFAYFLNMDVNWDKNMLQSAESAIIESFVAFILKEWYNINRYMDDYIIEETKFQDELKNIRTALMRGITSYRRPMNIFP